ncbi:MAG TPA: hypothetical protein VFV02_05350, partial [Acidimicrobiales bacterium]|nr:hypothetical protein [Acidimicrobiales bacterium]
MTTPMARGWHTHRRYAPAVIEVLPFAEAAALLDGLQRGYRDVDDRPSPLVVIDLDRKPDDTGCALVSPGNLPVVLVGVSRTGGAPPEVASAADILLAEDPAAPAPWVSASENVVGELARIEAATSSNPLATTTLMQVLRASDGLPAEAALVLESLAYATLQAGPEHRAWLDLPGRPQPDDDGSAAVR